MKLYLAAPFSHKIIMQKYREQLKERGYEVTSRWIDTPAGVTEFTSEQADHEGTTDLQDIDAAWACIFFTDVPSTTGGMHVEFGYALAQSKVTILVGKPVNIFHKKAMYQFNTWEDFLKGYVR